MFFWGANTWILLETAEFRNREGRLSEDPGYHRIELWVFKNFEAHPTEKCVSSFQASNEEISHSQSFHCGKWTRASWWDSADSLDGCCTPKPMPSHSKCWEPIGPAFKPREGLQSFHPKKKTAVFPKNVATLRRHQMLLWDWANNPSCDLFQLVAIHRFDLLQSTPKCPSPRGFHCSLKDSLGWC